MKKFSIYRLISIIAFLALIFILALPNFFNINKKTETEQCIKNMRAVYMGAEEFLKTEKKDFSGTTSDLERMGYLSKAYECPSEAPGDKYHINIKAEEGIIEVRCINEINSSPELSISSFEDLVYFVNILKFHQKPTSNFIYNVLSEEVKILLKEHEAYSSSFFDTRSILDWDKFIANLRNRQKDPMVKDIWEKLSASSQEIALKWHRVENPLTIDHKHQITDEINSEILAELEFKDAVIKTVTLPKEGKVLHKMGYSAMNQIQKQRFNRLMLEAIFPYEFQVSSQYNYPSDELKEELVRDLNRILGANLLNDQNFINAIKLSGTTVAKMEDQPENSTDILLVNRLLLQDAYPSILVRYEDLYSSHRLPQ